MFFTAEQAAEYDAKKRINTEFVPMDIMVTDEAIAILKSKRLIEGRKNNYTISLRVALLTHQLGRYVKEKGLETNDLEPLIVSLARKASDRGFKRSDAYDAVSHLLPTNKSKQQNMRFVGDLLKNMSKEGKIEGKGKYWFIK